MIEIGDGEAEAGAVGLQAEPSEQLEQAEPPQMSEPSEMSATGGTSDPMDFELDITLGPMPDQILLGQILPGQGLAGWFAQHLVELMEEVEPAQLGIVCARLGVTLSDVAPVHLPLGERVQRLLAYLLSREVQHDADEASEGESEFGEKSSEPAGFAALASALLADEATAEAATARGLPQVLYGAVSSRVLDVLEATAVIESRDEDAGHGPLLPQTQACICQPLPPPPVWLGRDAELGALDAHLRTGARVVFLRGAPGAGKSALLGRFLRELLVSNRAPEHPTAPAAVWQEAGFDGVFYWSFAHDCDVYAYLRAAADYVCGLAPGPGQQLIPERPTFAKADPASPSSAPSTVSASRPAADSSPSAVLAQWTGEESACRYHLDRLLDGLSRRSGPILFVLDGLERLQRQKEARRLGEHLPDEPALEELGDGRRRGVLEGELLDPCMASLLLTLTIGPSRAAAVATVYPSIPALHPWLGSRCVEIDLPPLVAAEGASLLRYSGVTSGADSDLEERSLEHGGHALTLYLFGRYLHAYFEGDGRAVTRSELPATDTGLHTSELRQMLSHTSLRQVLRAHLLALPDSARRLLDLCVILPGPLRISALQALLEQIKRSGIPQKGSPLLGAWNLPIAPASSAATFRAPTPPAVLLPDPTWLQGTAGLVERLSELEKLGLLNIVTMPDGDEGIEIHPLVREPIYREWLGSRGGFYMVPHFEMDGAHGYIPRGEQALELLEHVVGLLLAAGQPDAAYAVLEQRLGGYLHHVHYLGRARRFLFVVRQLYPAVAGVALSDVVWQRRYARLLTWEAETLRVLGQLEASLVTAQRQWPLGSTPLPRRLCQQARVLRSLGRLGQAAALATAARQSACSSFDTVFAAMELASIHLLSGDPAMCQVYLLDASKELRSEAAQLVAGLEALDLSDWLQRVWARRAMYLGHHERARAILEYCRAGAEERHSELDGAQCDVMLAELLRRERSYEAAGQVLHRALVAAGRSGDVETLILGGLVQGRVRLDTGHLDGAGAAFGPALGLCAEHGFGTFRIDLLVCRGALQLRRGDIESAERDARDALAYAGAPGCGYLWGEADALHLLATVLIAGRPSPTSPRHAEAAAHLHDELELRERMSDPTAPEVRWLLRRLRP